MREKISGMFSMAAAAVMSLNTEPGVNDAERQRFIYAPSGGFELSARGSMDGEDTMHRSSPFL